MNPSDPMHVGWHSITMHNRYIFERARKKREEEFDDILKGRTPRRKR
jgi:hypothetical protein